jgi:UDP-N-acetylglucosamine--N-acetylmuramyl-(pentapeptide) pyrophosphoryl-undecaprenol N-acetylglucosamine transferase
VLQYGEHPPSAPERFALAHAFFHEVLDLFAAADLAVIAGGETTLLEACARGTPSICVTLPDTPIGPHVRVLARDLQARGACVLAPAGAVAGEGLARQVAAILREPGRLDAMATAARSAVDPGACARIVAVAEGLLVREAVA